MRVVADTNTLVSGLLWPGPSRQILEAARAGRVQLWTSAALLVELEDVLQRAKFAQRLAGAGLSPRRLVVGYGALATVVKPVAIAPVVLQDPDDDEVLACATAAQAEVIVSGDHHLLALKQYGAIPIVTARGLLIRLRSSEEGYA